jgi:hypothetical protein
MRKAYIVTNRLLTIYEPKILCFNVLFKEKIRENSSILHPKTGEKPGLERLHLIKI